MEFTVQKIITKILSVYIYDVKYTFPEFAGTFVIFATLDRYFLKAFGNR